MYKPITNRVQNRRVSVLKLTAAELAAKKKKENELGENAKTGGTSEGSTKTIETNTVKKGDPVEKLLLPKDFEGGAKNPEYIKKKKALDKAIASGAGDRYKDKNIKGTKQIDTPGADYETNLQQSNTGRILTPRQRYELDSNIKRNGKNIRKSGNKLDKNKRQLAKLAEKGITSGRRFDKLTRKQAENQGEHDAFVAAGKNNALANASGGIQGETYQKADTNVTKGQRTAKQQDTEAQRVANLAAKNETQQNAEDTANAEVRQNQAEINNVTTGESGSAIGTNESKAINVGDTGGPGGMFDVGTPFAPTDYSKILQGGNTPLPKKGYKQKAKSMATRKLQGAQGKLPSHLQASIKAAPERTVLKKGYFKNK